MNRILAIALLAAGLIMLFFGFNAAESITSEVSEAVTGSPTDKSILLIVLGAVATLVGGFSLVARKRA